ncbi:guanylate kinase [Candidatus Mycoplasma mahonii]|uniref:guanylate kinase n=1 Tax=Candidatus Mycoplasma mahonii TaxID=3004105 RepID=UPI0026F20C6B|nr:guanylate kinase [Candidatus Mycoplasma mahonii]WKX02717.1 guanylate kinase [Candidatus Mycoplasma mahonii]
MNNNKIIIFTGPSGVGKATLEKLLFDNEDLKLEFSISATTRKPRKTEKNGQEYYFLTEKEFDQKIDDGDFIEWNEHFSNKYGTLKSEIKRIQDNGNLPFLEVETFGAENILNELNKEDVISIFVEPPSIVELKRRIIYRETESIIEIDERMKKVYEELTKTNIFDLVVVNDYPEKAVAKIKAFILGNI